MDPNLVFAKTAAGEQAVQERTRLVQRNLRNVLIMVDGRSSVQELCDRVGKPKVVRSALEQLQRDGYIEPVAAPASMWEKGMQAAGELAGAASEKLGGPRAPVEVEAPTPVAAPAPEPPAPNPFAAPPAPNPFAAASPSPFVADAAPAEAPARKPARAERVEPAKPVVEEKIEIKPIRRGPQAGSGVLGKAAMGLVGLMLLLVLVFFLYPYGSYRGAVEAELGRAFAQPVKLGSLRGTLAPGPALIVDRITIGETNETTVAELRLTPTFGSLFGGTRQFAEVVASGVRIPVERLPAMLAGLPALAQGDGYAVQRLAFARSSIALRDLVIGELAGSVDFGAGGRLTLANGDGSVRLELTPAAAGVDVGIELTGWKPLAGNFTWDVLSLQGNIADNALSTRKLEGRLFDGNVQGQVRFEWGAAQLALRGEIGLTNASARRLRDAIEMPQVVDGELGGRLRIAAAADTVAALRDKASIDGELRIARGNIEGIDLGEAVRRGARAPTQGGSTRFEQMAANWAWDGKALRLSGIEVSSGAMHASGSLGIDAGKQISGSFDARLKGSAGDIRMPVTIAGPLKTPVLQGGR